MNILEGADTSSLCYVSGSNPFLYNIREPKYKQNDMKHPISRPKINQYLKCLTFKSNFDFLISWPPRYCTEMFFVLQTELQIHLGTFFWTPCIWYSHKIKRSCLCVLHCIDIFVAQNQFKLFQDPFNYLWPLGQKLAIFKYHQNTPCG